MTGGERQRGSGDDRGWYEHEEVPGPVVAVGIAGVFFGLWLGWWMLTSEQRPSPSEADHAAGCEAGIPYRTSRSFTLYRNKPDAYWFFPFISTKAVRSGQVLIEDEVLLCAHDHASTWSRRSMWIRIAGDRGPGWIDAGPYDDVDQMLDEERQGLPVRGRRTRW